MSSDVVIEVNDLRKSYPRESSRSILGQQDVVQALHRVSFSVRKGTTFGIIGPNGAGKSTLLRIVCGITQPDSGVVKVEGTLSPVVGLQTGFAGQLTGAENVKQKAALLGHSKKKLQSRYDDIISFADIGEFIDEPFRTYSNGMKARLAFATAFAFDPEILVVDESLAVGDADFHAKCLARIAEIRNSGATVLIVTHGMAFIKNNCDEALLLHKGRSVCVGQPAEVVTHYEKLRGIEAEPSNVSPREVQLSGLAMCTADGANVSDLRTGNPYVIQIKGKFRTAVNGAIAHALITSPDGYQIWKGTKQISDVTPGNSVDLAFEIVNRLGSGSYRVEVVIVNRDGDTIGRSMKREFSSISPDYLSGYEEGLVSLR